MDNVGPILHPPSEKEINTPPPCLPPSLDLENSLLPLYTDYKGTMAAATSPKHQTPSWPDGTLLWLQSEGDAHIHNLRVLHLGVADTIDMADSGSISVTPQSIERHQMRAVQLVDLPPLQDGGRLPRR